MTIEIQVPDIGADEVEVTEILVKVGDSVAVDQTILNVEGDKAAMELPATEAGVVKEIKVAIGDMVKTGSVVMIFAGAESKAEAKPEAKADAEPETKAEAKTEAAPKAAATTSLQDINVPDIGADAVEVTEILVKVGDKVSADQSIMSVEGDKAAMELPAPVAGTVKEIKVAIGDKVSSGSLMMVFATADDAAEAATEAKPETTPDTAEKAQSAEPKQAESQPAKQEQAATASDGFVENKEYAHASPVIRRLAREFGINLAKVTATGRKGRVVKEDVQNYVKQLVKQASSGASATASSGGANSVGFDLIPWPKVDFAKFGEVETKPLSRIQKLSGANLHRNWVRIPHVTQFDEADITGLEDFRKQQNQLAEKKKLGVKYTPLVFIMKAVAKALEEFPTFSSSLSDDGASLILKKYIHIGIAVDTPNGLVVPVVRDVNKKGIIELSRELQEISAKARDGKLTSGDMQGGCFTISSLGGIGGTAFTPIVNAPEVAILGVSKSDIKPKWNGTEFLPALMLPLSLSYDHRVIDGALAARFTATLAGYLADIRQIIM
ncbi:dihydrolipoyllysine-residue acetyltransferase [Rheinheimera salexigens]|uniref:dihydrolipoyllysine-residue acetyltransferase n=1 Tax=Rheinheimera salexigens TaxID=1628148 RepID=UPI000943B09C|nr:dihydrolipoyllysine-residue acetyltransferase [Rheinheimera salexigens]